MSQPAEDPTDLQLMLAFVQGQADAFETLYSRHKGGVFRYFLRSLRESGLAEELAQDVWTSVIRARTQWQPEARFTTWLYRLAHNRLIDHYRRSNIVAFTSLDTEDDDEATSGMPSPETVQGADDIAAQRIAARRVVALVEALPPAQREAFLMQLEGGLSVEEIAAATGQGFETIKSRLRYALAKLRDGMKGHS